MSTPDTNWNLRPFMFVGYLTLGLLVFGVGAWAAVARISGAIVAPGAVEVEGNRQVVQHPTGGVITAINFRDGDEVREGEVLIRLEGQTLRAELGIVEGQWFEILARGSGLAAERDGLDTIEFDPEIVERAKTDPSVEALMAAQIQQFEARIKLYAQETQQLDERQTQIRNQIDGLLSLASATDEQITLMVREVEGQEQLLRQGLTQITRVLTLQRELASLRGTAGQVEATIAENRGKIAEIEIERVRLESARREEAISQMRDLEYREIELRERRRSLLDQIAKLEMRAPVSGIVYGSQADTLRGVISPAQPVMYIVPKDIPLVVRASVEPIHIDQVHVGQEASLRFTSFDMRSTPEVYGEVKSVSADAIVDQKTGARFYRVEIEVTDDMRTTLDGQVILPGMPVEAFIKTEDRTALTYFVKPLADYFNRAFREG